MSSILSLYWRNELLLAAAVGHLTVEVFSSLLPVMFPVLVADLGLSYTQIGSIVTIFIIAAAIPQPLFGYLIDRFGNRWFSSLSILWIACFMAAIAFARDYPVLILLATLAGLASSAFHPAGATSAAEAMGTAKGSSISIFLASGNLGYALGPLIGGALFTVLGLGGATLLILPALIIAFFIYRSPMTSARRVKKTERSDAATGTVNHTTIMGLGALGILMALRAWIHIGFSSYVPLLLVERNLTLLSSSRILSLLLVSVAIGSLVGGFVADRSNRRLVLFAALLLSVPINIFFLTAPETLIPVAAFFTGVFIGMPVAIILITAQELLPKRVGVASGLALGIAYGAGSLGTALTGLVAEHYTLTTSLLILGLTPLLSSLCALALPKQSSIENEILKTSP